ncbi:MAG: FAD-dependent oxidoreductase [Peptococcaceae bacterium]|jgi:2,4-dienoyl-CoA reductase-like NADH-dependent reductase (Old Yellow Enzyme family)/thioredoxin reductase|nr:FAD-dependent oxidoreductase [Peptococcaceae bacterium]MDH7524383.1 FAD-dependent oxidoreductase [Peptococcaceae bacterium]
MQYPNLFSSAKIGKMTVENRIIMAPMATNFALDGGGVSQVQHDYYAERARGGAGLIIVENANVSFPLGANGATQLRIDEDRFIPGLAHLVDTIHEAKEGCKAAIQLNHAGATAKSYRVGAQPVSASNIPATAAGEVPRPLTREEFAELAAKFGEAALRAKRAGFDAVEVHGGYGYLLGQVISPYTNRRSDEYGGSVENRMRFPLMVVEEIRRRVGPDFPILFRMNGDEFMEGGLTLEEAKRGAKLLEEASVDLIHVTAGNGYTAYRHLEPMSFPEAWKAYLAGEVKKVVGVPVAAVGVIRDPARAEAIIEAGVDFVAIGRGLIADPEWPNKARQGKAGDIRKCISCLVCASRRVFEDLPIRCSVNPLVGHEGEARVVKPAGKAKKVVVIGGGPAGMEASILASQNGHRVTLVERRKELGGQLLLAKVPPHKDKIAWFIDYLADQVRRAGVEVRLGVEADAETVASMAPDAVIVATGGQPITLFLQDSPSAVTAHAMLEKGLRYSNKKVVVIGGGLVGCESAEYLAEQGNRVTVVEMLPQVLADTDPLTRADLLLRLNRLGVDLRANFRVKSVTGTNVTGDVTQGGEVSQQELEAELLVIAVGARPDDALVNELKNIPGLEAFAVGDCVKPGRIVHAVRQAAVAASKL